MSMVLFVLLFVFAQMPCTNVHDWTLLTHSPPKRLVDVKRGTGEYVGGPLVTMIAHRFHAQLSRTFVVNKNNKPSNLLIRKPGSLRNFFLGFICNCLSYFTTEKITFTSILYPQFTHMICIIYTHNANQEICCHESCVHIFISLT